MDAPIPSTSTELAVDRTRLAHDRTMMAWVRTATSLISFGFTIYKFFQSLREGQRTPARRFGPREFALSLIAIGLLSLVFATIQSRRELRIMRKHYPEVPLSLANVVAGLVGLLGVGTFLAIIFRL
jgi:putative membrane protein